MIVKTKRKWLTRETITIFPFFFVSYLKKKKCLGDFEIGPKVHKKGRAVVFGRPRGPLFTSAARLCGTARNYFQPSVCVRNENKKCIPHTEKRDIMMAIITPSKSLKISLQHKREKQEAKNFFFFLCVT